MQDPGIKTIKDLPSLQAVGGHAIRNRFQPARFAYRLPDCKPWGLEAGTEYFLTIQGVSITYP